MADNVNPSFTCLRFGKEPKATSGEYVLSAFSRGDLSTALSGRYRVRLSQEGE